MVQVAPSHWLRWQTVLTETHENEFNKLLKNQIDTHRERAATHLFKSFLHALVLDLLVVT